MKLKELIESGFGREEGLNCAEKIFYGANKVYDLGLSDEVLRLSAGFGGGMGVKTVCGTISSSMMVLSRLLVKNHAHDCKELKDYETKYITTFKTRLGDIMCGKLKAVYFKPEVKCHELIVTAAEILDEIYEEITKK